MTRIAFIAFLFVFTGCSTISNNASQNTVQQGNNTETKPEPKAPPLKPYFYQKGFASYYSSKFSGKKTASGEKYDPKIYTAASRTLPFSTLILVKCEKTNGSVIVRINDRGPFSKHRILDLSEAAAKELGIYQDGYAKVKVYILR